MHTVQPPLPVLPPPVLPRLTWGCRGRVGPKVSSLIARHLAPETVRVECVNNPSFWLVVDLDTRTAHGCVKGCRLPGTSQFAVRATERGMRIDHPLTPWFWLEMDNMRGCVGGGGDGGDAAAS